MGKKLTQKKSASDVRVIGNISSGRERVDPLRSINMARVRGKDTKPELLVRRALHARGYRYRVHAAELPGRPDIVFRPKRKAIFVHGCFWHRHQGCPRSSMPKTRVPFWQNKFAQNCDRDARNREELEHRGWDVLIVWECETRDMELLLSKLNQFVGDRKSVEFGTASNAKSRF